MHKGMWARRAAKSGTAGSTPKELRTLGLALAWLCLPLVPLFDLSVFGAGDIARCNSNADEATAKLLDVTPGTVFAVGDLAYDNGSKDQFSKCYGPTWGRHKGRTRPTPVP